MFPTGTTGNAGPSSTALVTVYPQAGGDTYQLVPAAVGGYTVSVQNSDNTGSTLFLTPGQTKQFTITYTPVGGGFDYNLTNNGNVVVTKQAGNVTGQGTVNLNLVTGSPSLVNLSLSGVPAGVALSQAPVACNPNCSSTINLTVSPSAVAGTYPIIVTGSHPTAGTRTTSFNLVINAPVALNVSCSASPSPATVNQPVTWSAVVTGGTAPYSYSWSGTNFTGNPTSNPYVHTYGTTGSKNAQVTVTDSGGVTATCPVTTVQVSIDPTFQEI
jgi:hypothetical protein